MNDDFHSGSSSSPPRPKSRPVAPEKVSLHRYALAGLAATATLAAGTATAFDVDRNFAGSAQLDYLFVPSTIRARGLTFDGFTTELALKLTVDFTDDVSASIKICYGCHGFETNMAHVDIRLFDLLNIRVGRMNPAFGDFPVRHDPANHRANSKPLPYDMGRMLRLREWNLSILPAPYVDNGAQVSGTHWFGSDTQLDYAVWVVSGLKGNDNAFDIDFVQSRSGSLYYVDNNSEPAYGGRLGLTINPTAYSSATLGVSGMYGNYDPSGNLSYVVVGIDLYVRIDALVLRGEYLLRRTEFAVGSDPTSRFRYEFNDLERNFFIKDGFYLETEYPFTDWLEAFYRFDGMRRTGNVAQASPLSDVSGILRHTLGANFLIYRGVRVKISGEHWDFSDFDDEIALHLGLVANF